MSEKVSNQIPQWNTLSGIVNSTPDNLKKIIKASGHRVVNLTDNEFDVAKEKEKHLQTLMCRGVTVRHKKRGTLVTIIKANVKDKVHRVVESKSGAEFLAKQENLEAR